MKLQYRLTWKQNGSTIQGPCPTPLLCLSNYLKSRQSYYDDKKQIDFLVNECEIVEETVAIVSQSQITLNLLSQTKRFKNANSND